jgi:hypothetical protein
MSRHPRRVIAAKLRKINRRVNHRAHGYRRLILAALGLAALVLGIESRLTPDLSAIAPPVDFVPRLSDQAWFGAFVLHQEDPIVAACRGSENLAQFKVLYWWE